MHACKPLTTQAATHKHAHVRTRACTDAGTDRHAHACHHPREQPHVCEQACAPKRADAQTQVLMPSFAHMLMSRSMHRTTPSCTAPHLTAQHSAAAHRTALHSTMLHHDAPRHAATYSTAPRHAFPYRTATRRKEHNAPHHTALDHTAAARRNVAFSYPFLFPLHKALPSHRAAPHRTQPHCTAPHGTALHCNV